MKQEQEVVIIDCLTSDISIDIAGGCPVVESNIESLGRRSHRVLKVQLDEVELRFSVPVDDSNLLRRST